MPLKPVHRYSRNCPYKTIFKCLGLYAWQTLQGIVIQWRRRSAANRFWGFWIVALSSVKETTCVVVDSLFAKAALGPVDRAPNAARSRVNGSPLTSIIWPFQAQTRVSSARPTSEPASEYPGQDSLEYLMSKPQVLEWFEKLRL